MKIETKIEINASAEKAWEVLGEGFGEISEWTSSLKSSTLDGELQVGGIRTCESSTRFGPFKPGVVQERLVTYDPSMMTFEYEGISGMPDILRKASNRWSVHKIDEEHCIVQSQATVEFRGILNLFGPLLKYFMKSDLDKFFDELRFRVVNGRPHPQACSIKQEQRGNVNRVESQSSI